MALFFLQFSMQHTLCNVYNKKTRIHIHTVWLHKLRDERICAVGISYMYTALLGDHTFVTPSGDRAKIDWWRSQTLNLTPAAQWQRWKLTALRDLYMVALTNDHPTAQRDQVITDVYIYILLDTVLATDFNKYSLASARCQPIWRTKLANWIYF